MVRYHRFSLVEEDVPILVETTQAPFIIFDTENIPIFPYLKQRKEPDMKKLAPHDSSVKPLDAVPAEEIDALDTRIALIQALIPLGLDAVSALLQEEVTRLAGPRYQRKEADQAHRRWGGQPGSVYLGVAPNSCSTFDLSVS